VTRPGPVDPPAGLVAPDRLARAVDQLLNQISHWTPSRWAASRGVRADQVHALAQALADAEARCTGRAVRPVPRLESDTVLPDQIRVLAADLLAAGPDPDTLATALRTVEATRTTLAHRPPG